MDNKNKRKSQSAMEYLMTYGWSILIIAVVVAVLFGLGVFNTSSTSTVHISAPYGYTISNPVMVSNGFLSVNLGSATTALIVTATNCTTGSGTPTLWPINSISVQLTIDSVQGLTFQCPATRLGASFKGNLWVQYTINGQTGTMQVGQVIIPVTQPSTSSTTTIISCSASPTIFSSAGGPYSTTVPTNCANVIIQLWGGGGGGADSGTPSNGGSGGGGGYITGTYGVTPGSTLYIFVGAAGAGGGSGSNGAYGGTCSTVGTTSSESNPSVVAVAAGGGGSGGYCGGGGAGGAGGGTSGASGQNAGGNGATQSGGGSGTPYSGSNPTTDGGGGGCGYYGGGTSAYCGGGGGSSWANTILVSSITNTGGSGANPGGSPTGNVGKGGTAGNTGYAGNVILTWEN